MIELKKLQEELVAKFFLLLVEIEDSDEDRKRALEIINQLKGNINALISFNSKHGTVLDFLIMADTQGFNTNNPKRINNKTLEDLEKAIKEMGGKTLEELDPIQIVEELNSTQRNGERQITSRGANTNARDNQELTALQLAVMNGSNASIIDLLIRGGANIYARDYDRPAPLRRAVINGNIDVVRATLDRSSTDVEEVTIQQHTRERQNTPDIPR
ncbi:MAG TPA: hypothetical protein DEQ74_00525 [Wolbachia sp.]|jgi:ankyrin repeat protein|uniref:ankyrin repeat domain-containing protein n=1 Tax=Wolbachia endosymbiont of Pentalonia nigronervosa TaxID=1301914 RepID=UPI000EE586C4|nr:ankyrin repeat domain-containing protein [Wolbachia endosymbiont of Pentalonia nigronervosa]MBD0391830.1 hypothetical protein [Wolbachia endosymbiont of Pentalonia nigronervosa]HCE59311.1 hypothetical protein [Wolbachia sp.]